MFLKAYHLTSLLKILALWDLVRLCVTAFLSCYPSFKKNVIHAVIKNNVMHELFKLTKPSCNMLEQFNFPADIDVC